MASNFGGRSRRQPPPPPSVPPGFGPARTTPKYPPGIINPVIIAARLRDGQGIVERPGYAAAPSNPMLGLPPGISNPILDRERESRIQQLCDQRFTQAGDTPDYLDAVPREDEKHLVSQATASRSAAVQAAQLYLAQVRQYRFYSLSSPGDQASQVNASGKTSSGENTQPWAPALCNSDLTDGSTPTTGSTVPATPDRKFNAAAPAFFPPDSAPIEVQAETYDGTASEAEAVKPQESSTPAVEDELSSSVEELVDPKGPPSPANTLRPPHPPALANPEPFATAEQALECFLSRSQTPRPSQSSAQVDDAELASAVAEQVDTLSYPSSEAETVKPAQSPAPAIEAELSTTVQELVGLGAPPSPAETLTPPQSPPCFLEGFPKYSATAEPASADPYCIFRPGQEALDVWLSTTSDEIMAALQVASTTAQFSEPEVAFDSYKPRSYTSSPWAGSLHRSPFMAERKALPTLAPRLMHLLGRNSTSQAHSAFATIASAPPDLTPPTSAPGSGRLGGAVPVEDEDKVMKGIEYETPTINSVFTDTSAPTIAHHLFHPGVWTNFDGTPVTIPLIRGTIIDHRDVAAQNQLREMEVPLMSTTPGPTPGESELAEELDQSSLPIFTPPHPYEHLSWQRESLLPFLNSDLISVIEMD